LKKDGGRGSDLRERTFEFACAAVSVHRRVYRSDADLRDLSRQFVRAASAVGAMLEEADAGHSRADFISKCTTALKEAREARYWLRILHRVCERERPSIEKLGKEATEIVAILTTIIKRTRAK
jgi:four helix bundle protein